MVHFLLSSPPRYPLKWLAGLKTDKYTVFVVACLQVTPHLHPTHQCPAFNTTWKHYFLRLEITGFPWALIYHLTSFLFNLSLQSLFHSMKWYPCTPHLSFWGKPTKIIFCLDVMESACNFLKQLSENNILLIEYSSEGCSWENLIAGMAFFTWSSTYLERKGHEDFLKEQYFSTHISERYLCLCLSLHKRVAIEIFFCLIRCLLNQGFKQRRCN